ncbi:MAG TPA: hypothetical protein VFV02_05245 [Acidimicrobiales bacterium]|nr:hypothetical protein [Acidimicrobiales bacterium]
MVGATVVEMLGETAVVVVTGASVVLVDAGGAEEVVVLVEPGVTMKVVTERAGSAYEKFPPEKEKVPR